VIGAIRGYEFLKEGIVLRDDFAGAIDGLFSADH
jgi:hypothetical protein